MKKKHRFTKAERSRGGKAAIASLTAKGTSLAEFRKAQPPEKIRQRGLAISARRRLETAVRAMRNLHLLGEPCDA